VAHQILDGLDYSKIPRYADEMDPLDVAGEGAERKPRTPRRPMYRLGVHLHHLQDLQFLAAKIHDEARRKAALLFSKGRFSQMIRMTGERLNSMRSGSARLEAHWTVTVSWIFWGAFPALVAATTTV
jgi:hypothetical protein